MGHLIAIFAAFLLIAPVLRTHNNTSSKEGSLSSIYDFNVKNIDGTETSLEQFRGKVMLIVNVASECGYTYQYEGLQTIYSDYADRGLVVLGFPANNFGGQEPGTNEEIRNFCTTKFHVTFPMFEKISVIGEDIHPLYSYLTSPETDPQFAGNITWNFNKFLIDRNGTIIARFSSKDKPESREVRDAIEAALQ